MHVFYGIHILTTWLGYEKGRCKTKIRKFDVKQNITKHFKSKQQKSFISFNIVTTLSILQNFIKPPPRSNFIPTLSTLPIILIVNLVPKVTKNKMNSNLIAVN